MMRVYSKGKMDYGSKRIIIADLDGTLSEDRTPISKETARLVSELLRQRRFAVVTAARWSRLKYQVLDVLEGSSQRKMLSGLYLLPQSATRFYRLSSGRWKSLYAENLSLAERKRIKGAIRAWIKSHKGEGNVNYERLIDDRISQVSFAMIGRDTPLAIKKKWDPSGEKKRKVAKFLEGHIPEFGIGIGGTSTIDITRKGLDKSYGIKKIRERLGYKDREMVFIGDRLFKGGNDYPVRKTGIDCIQVNSVAETNKVLRDIINSRLKGV